MLAVLVGLQAASGLLLRGAWDLWAQSAVLLVLIAGVCLWSILGIVRGRLRLPSSPVALWAGSLGLLSFASALFGPLRAYCLPAWAAAAAGLWLLPAATLLTPRERARVDQAVRAVAWILVLLAAYQRVHGQERPPSMFLNQNVFAGAILLLLPFAARARDWALLAGLMACLWWTRSAGAWIGFSAALVLHRRAAGPVAFWFGAAAGLAALVAVYAKLQSPEVAHRLAWWLAAARMGGDAPWKGLGPGAFAYALPAYVFPRPELNSLFAHQHFLETAAERGWPYLLLWVLGLAVVLRRAEAAKRFGPVAALVHGCFDYALSVPGVFWLFCLSTSWALAESEEAAPVRSGRKVSVAAGILCVALACAYWVSGNWAADRLRSSVGSEGGVSSAGEAERILSRSEEIRPHPEAARMRAELARAQGRFGEEAAHLERAVSLDPYRASNWMMLEESYLRLGRPSDAARARARGARTCPALRSEAS